MRNLIKVPRALLRLQEHWLALKTERAERIKQARSWIKTQLKSLAEREPETPEAVIRDNFDTVEQAIFAPRRLGLAIGLLFFVVGGGWAAFAPLSSAAIAPGIVSPKSSRQNVQHLEGGIIRAINIREGDVVESQQSLIVLEDIGQRAEVGRLTTRWRHLDAIEARLVAERDGLPTVRFSEDLLRGLSDIEVREIIDAQVNQFETRRANDDSRKAILAQRIAQLDQQIGGFEEQLTSTERQNALIQEEIDAVFELVNKGLERKPRLLGLERTKAELLGQQGELKARIAQGLEAIGETKLEIMKTDIQRAEDVEAELADIQAKKMDIDKQLKESQDRLARTEIRAPVSGTVLDVRFKTAGGVIRPGENVVSIVPNQDSLVIDARVSPKDIDVVRSGLEAAIRFPAYTQRLLPSIQGVVTKVSADTHVDERTGEHYYSAQVEVDRDYLETIAPEIALQPGMVAEVFITTGKRTVLGYLLEPFVSVVRRSLREA